MKFKITEKGRILETLIYPLLVLVIMWTAFLVDRYFHLDLYRYGVKPQVVEGLKGVLFMPFIHGQDGFSHIINNSVPIVVLLGALIYFYREIALKVILFTWLGTGFLLWYFAENLGRYHIGMSGIIYGLFGFLLLSGFLRKFLPLQAITLFVAFMYGSMIWGVLPTEERISWEGHLSGMLIGFLLAFAFRKMGPRAPKYRYEIEDELGIEPPDFEGEWLRRQREWEEQQLAIQERIALQNLEANALENENVKMNANEKPNSSSTTEFTGLKIEYDYIPPKNKKKPE